MPIPEEGIPSNLTGTVPPGYHPAYGGAPLIPNPIAAMWQALGGNLDAMPDIQNLAGIYNLFNYNQQAQQVAGTPGFSNVNDLLHGKLPQDVVNRIAQSAAERNVMGGFDSDSPNLNASLLSATGLASLDAQNRGQEQYGNLLGRFPKPGMFDMSSMFVTPEAMQAALAAANVSAASPNPKAAADAELDALLKMIEAGKNSIPGPGGVPSITQPTANTYKPPPGPGTVVGSGPPNGTGTQKGFTVDYTPWRTNSVKSTPAQPDMVQNAATQNAVTTTQSNSTRDRARALAQAMREGWKLGGTSPDAKDFIQDTVFGYNPNIRDTGTLGFGLDPVLAAMLGSAPESQFGQPIEIPNMWSGYGQDKSYDFGQQIVSPDMFTGATNSNTQGYDFGSTITSPDLFTGIYGSNNKGSSSISNWWEYERPLDVLFGEPISELPGIDMGGFVFNPVTGGSGISSIPGWGEDELLELFGP